MGTSLLLFLCSFAAPACGQKPSSVYTDLSGSSCKLVKEEKETGAAVSNCPGVAGYKLLVADEDARMSVDVVTPDNRAHPLHYWHVITRGFSSIGPRAEWRVVNRGDRPVPIALIVRVNDNSKRGRPVSYLAVAKISDAGICVTAKVPPSATANEEARQAGDKAAGEKCLEQ